jgi:hypothetical protein
MGKWWQSQEKTFLEMVRCLLFKLGEEEMEQRRKAQVRGKNTSIKCIRGGTSTSEALLRLENCEEMSAEVGEKRVK